MDGIKTQKNISFNLKFQEVEKINPLFSRGKARVFYTGINRNGSHFSKDSVLKSIGSIYGIPVVGEYLEEVDNFGDHGVSVEIKDDEVKYISRTVPYGFVSENANIYWEEVTEEDGKKRDYLTVDGIYLWSGRYEEVNSLIDREHGQSMEIEVVEGSYAIVEGQEVFKIEEFIFSALCILGIDKNGEGKVEPAFESANISAYALDKDEFKKSFKQMMEELNFSLAQGGENMTKKDEKDLVEDLKTEETQEETQDDKDIAEKTEETETKEEPEADEKVETTTEETKEVSETEVKTEDSENTETEGTSNQEFSELKEKYEAVQKELDDLKAEKAEVQEQLKELKEYKRKREEQDIREKFSGKLTDVELDSVFTELKDSNLEKIEEKIFALIGMKNFSITSDTAKNEDVKISVKTKEKDSNNPYGNIFN